MSNSVVKTQATAIATSASQEVGLDPAMIIALLEIVLPLLINLPCFKNKNPEEMKTALTRNPNLMRIMTASMIRNRSKTKLTGQQAFALADTVLEQLAASSDAEIQAFATAARGN